MVQITYRKKMLSIAQIWFADEEASEAEGKADICFWHGMPEISKERNSLSTEFHTLLSDLRQEEETLLSLINKNVRYEIRRNCKEGVACSVFSPKELKQEEAVIRQFAETYETMYREKGRKVAFNWAQFKAYLEEEAIWLTAAYQDREPLVFHSYIVGDKQVRLLHSASDFRSSSVDANLVARANKRLHWEDMLLFRKKGIEIYDWGGVSSLENPNGIDAFKCKFGGSPITYYNVYTGKTLPGKLVVSAMKIKNGRKTDAGRDAK